MGEGHRFDATKDFLDEPSFYNPGLGAWTDGESDLCDLLGLGTAA